MGGCSSKPKTAEFEGAMDMQEEIPQDESVRKSGEMERIGLDTGLKGINKEQESSEGGIQNHIVEEEGNHLRNMVAETRMHLKDAFDADGEYNGERHMLEDDQHIKKEACKDGISKNSIKEATSELQNGLKNSAPASSVVSEDQILNVVGTTAQQETPMISNIGTDTLDSFAECETQAVEKHTSYDNRAPHLHEEMITLHNDYMNSGKDLHFEAERTFVLLESAVTKDVGLELQKDFLGEAEKEVTSESKEADRENEGLMLVASPRQTKQIRTVEMEPQDVSEETQKGAVEVESQETHANGGQSLANNPQHKDRFEENKDCHIAANGACLPDNHSKEIGKEVLFEKSLLFGKDMSGKDEVIAASLDVSNGQQSLAFKCSCSPDGGVCKEHMEAKLLHDAASTCSFTRSSAMSQAEPISMHLLSADNGSQKESTGEVVSDASWYILEKVEIANNHPSAVVLKEHIRMEFPKNGIRREISRAADEKVVLSEDAAADSKVTTANKKKPEAQPIPFLDAVGLAFKNIPAQEMNAPDIDDVLEKLASEFERQESLSRVN